MTLPSFEPGASKPIDAEHIGPSPVAKSAGACGGSCAFVLDDEAEIGKLVCNVLERCGLVPRAFTAPEPFRNAFEETTPELVVLDLSLGESDAVEIIRHLKSIEFRGNVLLISGRDETVLREIAEIGGKYGLAMLPPLKKPFRPADLEERLSTRAAHNPPTRGTAANNGSLLKPRVELAEALRNHWLEVWYQPKIDLKTGTVCGAEALIRARHPVHGIITPDRLLPPAGDPGFAELTEFVMERAAADWSRFAGHGLQLGLQINAPVSVIQHPDFIDLVRRSLPSDPRFPGLTIEITEDELIQDGEWAREVGSQLKLYNVGLSIDDFGAGYASLSRLNDLPFLELKIDRGFVLGCAAKRLKRGLCQTVVDLGHRFGARVCAEGVETVEDLRALVGMGCDSAQGFLFARPMPAADLASMLQRLPSKSPLFVLRDSLDEPPSLAPARR
jgi:EAL domain-containing protein (putative c-di-GMP-specific phosphodiesterase class I)/FixJ family two-component response regulator